MVVRRNRNTTSRGHTGRGSRGSCGGTRRRDGSGRGVGNKTSRRK